MFVNVQIMFQCGSHTMKMKEYLPRLFHPCRDCQTELSAEPAKPHRFEFAVKQPRFPAFRVRLDAPAVVCPGCGKRELLWTDEIDAQIDEALHAAISSLAK